MNDFIGEGIGGEGNPEKAINSPYRRLWRLPGDLDYRVDPRKCFERTVQNTAIVFKGSKDPLPATSFLFSVPIYHQEWTQGNLQKLLYSFLEREYSENVGAIEINFLLNELSNDRERRSYPPEDNVLGKFRTSMIGIFPPTYDFSSMTHEEYLRFREQEEGTYIPYPANLAAGSKYLENRVNDPQLSGEERERSKKELEEALKRERLIFKTNYETRTFLTVLIEAQRLGRELLEDGANSTVYYQTLRLIGELIDKYQDQPDLQKIIQLAYAKSDKVNITMLDLLDTDFLAEGFWKKGLAQVRCIGADYAIERVRDLEKGEKVIVQMWDADLIPSSNFIDELKNFYDREKIDITWLPTGPLTAPGTSKQLLETSINYGVGWCGTDPYYFGAQSTPKLSFRVPILKELNGIVGDPPGESLDDDRKTGWRLVRYMFLAQNEKYARKFMMPPIMTLMHDRPGIVDASGRETGNKGYPEGPIDYTLAKILASDEYFIFADTDNFRAYHNSYKAQLNALSEDLEDFEASWRGNYYSVYKFNSLEELSKNSQIMTEAQSFYRQAAKEYFSEYQELARLNRLTVKEFLRQRRSGNIRQSENGEMVITDLAKVSEPLKFHLINYLKSNANFLNSLDASDWDYLEYLLKERQDCPTKRLSRLQQILREYLGEVLPIDEVLKVRKSYQSSEERPAENTQSFLYATYALKLAHDLTVRNFQQVFLRWIGMTF